VDGLKLTFHLAGINNQNFLMRDEETGTYWQQISGAAISGPLKGRNLVLVSSDELTLGLWKSEQPNGTFVKDAAEFTSQYAKKDWDVRMQKAPTVLSYAQPGMTARTLVLGIRAFGMARAYDFEMLLKQKLVRDRLGGVPIMIVVGPDGQSVRAFRAQAAVSNRELDFFRLDDDSALLMDDATGSRWNFQGCAVEGSAKGVCLQRIDIIEDYWFDWRHYNPATSVFGTASNRER
jgi:Protein of unknown function (DUF3179)